MLENKDSNRSLLLPKWHSVSRISSKEYLGVSSKPALVDFSVAKAEFENDYRRFLKSPTYTIACDLLSSSVILGYQDRYNEIARFIDGFGKKGKSLEALFRNIRGEAKREFDKDRYQDRISLLRQTLRGQNKNSLLWLELGREYVAIGEAEQARKAIIVANSLAPDSRFISRATARFFIHNDEPDVALRISEKASNQTQDPWIRSTALNCLIIAGHNLKKIPVIRPEDFMHEELFHYSELLSSAAMLDIHLGNEKRAKKLLRLAWTAPPETVIANAEWIIRNRFPSLAGEAAIDFEKSYEASTWESYIKMDFQNAVRSSVLWSLEEPYSTHPYTCGSGIACLARKYDEAIQIAKKGLVANPSDVMLKNNLAYSHLRKGDTQSAAEILSTIRRDILNDDLCYLTATLGLYSYKTGKHEQGRALYKKAYALSLGENNPITPVKVLLNNAIAELGCVSVPDFSIIEKAAKLADTLIDPGVSILLEEMNNAIKLTKR